MKKPTLKQKLAKTAFLKFPLKSDREIATLTKIDNSTISKYRKDFGLDVNKSFMEMTADQFVGEIGEAIQHWKQLLEENEKLKSDNKTILLQNKITGESHKQKIPLDPLEILQINKEIRVLREKIVMMGQQTKVRIIMRKLKNNEF